MDSSDEVIKISKRYLEELLNHSSRTMVGKLLKRIELDGGNESLKRQAKEITYESWRDFRDLIYAHQAGLSELTQFKFNKSKE